MTLNEKLTLLVATLGTAIALGTLIKAFFEYQQQGRQKRAEQFFQIRRDFINNERVKNVARSFDNSNSNQALACISLTDRRDYLGLFEEVALVVNSGLIKPQIAHYMFGYHIISCWDSEVFWNGLHRDSRYWSLFRDFVTDMKRIDQTFVYRREELRF